jgi:hypothetical protein
MITVCCNGMIKGVAMGQLIVDEHGDDMGMVSAPVSSLVIQLNLPSAGSEGGRGEHWPCCYSYISLQVFEKIKKVFLWLRFGDLN